MGMEKPVLWHWPLRKEKAIVNSAGKEIGGKAQICLSNGEFGVEFKGVGKDGLVCEIVVEQVAVRVLQHGIFWTTSP